VWLVAIKSIELFDVFKVRSVFGKVSKLNAHEWILFKVEGVESALPKQERDFKYGDLGHCRGFISSSILVTVLDHHLLLDL